ncbi:MAG TPA: DinB family protein [Acidimicrobiales bacterium]|jgi:uncharacterized damage-inducible protein DinB|nr:DinB family protein [Acidimicrobiales bacterium]
MTAAAATTTTDQKQSSDLERRDFVETLDKHRKLLVRTVRGLSEEQIRLHPTASALCLGGVIKHVTLAEQNWSRFITQGAPAMGGGAATRVTRHADTFELAEGDSVETLLQGYDDTARSTDELIMTVPSLDVAHPLPDAPWFEQGASWSARRVLLHVIAETAQHAGHADIIRETIDGKKTMG